MVVADGESPGDRVEVVEDNLAFVSAWTEEELGRQYSMLVMMKSASRSLPRLEELAQRAEAVLREFQILFDVSGGPVQKEQRAAYEMSLLEHRAAVSFAA